jgi:hypothetical protein
MPKLPSGEEPHDLPSIVIPCGVASYRQDSNDPDAPQQVSCGAKESGDFALGTWSMKAIRCRPMIARGVFDPSINLT